MHFYLLAAKDGTLPLYLIYDYVRNAWKKSFHLNFNPLPYFCENFLTHA